MLSFDFLQVEGELGGGRPLWFLCILIFCSSTVPQTDAITCDPLPTPLFIRVRLTDEEGWVVLSSLLR